MAVGGWRAAPDGAERTPAGGWRSGQRADFGLDAHERRRALHPYVERFGVVDEDRGG